jgi:hypothetical protein
MVNQSVPFWSKSGVSGPPADGLGILYLVHARFGIELPELSVQLAGVPDVRRFILLKSSKNPESVAAGSWHFAAGFPQPIPQFLLNRDDAGMLYRPDSINGITPGKGFSSFGNCFSRSGKGFSLEGDTTRPRAPVDRNPGQWCVGANHHVHV